MAAKSAAVAAVRQLVRVRGLAVRAVAWANRDPNCRAGVRDYRIRSVGIDGCVVASRSGPAKLARSRLALSVRIGGRGAVFESQGRRIVRMVVRAGRRRA